MKDIFFYMQLVILILNVTTFLFLLKEPSYKYRFVRISLLIAVSLGIIINFGKVTWLTVLFSFTPFLTLLNFKQHGQFDRIIKRYWGFVRGDKQHIQGVHRYPETLLEETEK